MPRPATSVATRMSLPPLLSIASALSLLLALATVQRDRVVLRVQAKMQNNFSKPKMQQKTSHKPVEINLTIKFWTEAPVSISTSCFDLRLLFGTWLLTITTTTTTATRTTMTNVDDENYHYCLYLLAFRLIAFRLIPFCLIFFDRRTNNDLHCRFLLLWQALFCR